MLYLVDKPLADVAFRTARDDPDATIVLLQDGVALLPEERVPDHVGSVYAVARDLEVRGLEAPNDVEPIGYDTLIDLVVEHEVKNFV